jgi:hypothetical protein
MLIGAESSLVRRRNMTNKTGPKATDYRTCLEELAESRNFLGARELALEAAKADPRFTTREILEDPGRVGRALDAVLSLSEEEKDRLARAWLRAFLRPKA